MEKLFEFLDNLLVVIKSGTAFRRDESRELELRLDDLLRPWDKWDDSS